MFEITLNTEAAMVLLRCLRAGEAATSQAEAESGVHDLVQHNVQMLRAAVCQGLQKHWIEEAANSTRKQPAAPSGL